MGLLDFLRGQGQVRGTTREGIEETYSRIPFAVEPPQEIFVLKGHDLTTARLHHAGQGGRWEILGFHDMGTDYIVMSGTAGAETALHEGVHYNGMSSEARTRLRTRVLLVRAALNIGIFRREVHYREENLTPAQSRAFLEKHKIRNPSGGEVEIGHLIYEGP